MVIIKKKNYWPAGPVENQLLWPELARPPKKCVRASGHIANVKPWVSKKNGGWVGGVSSMQFFWDFLNFFNFAKGHPYYYTSRMQMCPHILCPFLAFRPQFHSNPSENLSTPRYCQSTTFGWLTFCVYPLLFYGIRV